MAREWSVDVQKGGDPSQTRKGARGGPTVADLADQYLTKHARPKKKPRSVESDETILRLHVLPTFGTRQAASITRADISKLHHAMKDKPGAANRTLTLLSKMFNLAEKWGFRPDGSNPCRHMDRYPERSIERFLSGGELKRLGNALAKAEKEKTEPPSAITAVRLLVLTGARLSEILTLKWNDVRMERAMLRLADSKTGAKTI